MLKVKSRQFISVLVAICMAFTMVMSFSTSASAAEVSSDTPVVIQGNNESIVPYARGDVIAQSTGILKVGNEVTLNFKINNIFGKRVVITAATHAVNGGSGSARYYHKAYNTAVIFDAPNKIMETIQLPYGNHSITLRQATSDCVYVLAVYED